jgi:hypothetical protein
MLEYRSTPEAKEKMRARCKKYTLAHPEKRRAIVRARKSRPEIRLLENLRSRFLIAMKLYSTTGKIMKSDKYGIDYKKIIDRLGECPGARCDYHVDHVIPLARFNFNDPDQIRLAFAPENHQWLPAVENMKKHASLPATCPPGLEAQYEIAIK